MDREDVVDELVARCLARFEECGDPDVEAQCADRPELRDAVRKRLNDLERAGFLTPVDAGSELPERFGDFRILEHLGRGGMGVVYRARQESVGREVALKIVRPDQLAFPGARERFRREVETVVRLRHPGIAPVHAVGDVDGVPYFAMELVEGGSLADAIGAAKESGQATGAALARWLAQRTSGESSGGSPSKLFTGSWNEVVARIVREVAETLAYCHRRGVVHRDVKPSNVMLTADGRVLLVDFGLAFTSSVERITRTGSQLGSLPYMAPEQVDGRVADQDERTDVYGLGVTLFEACTLDLPHDGESFTALRDAILLGRTRPFRPAHGHLERDLAAICEQAMAVEPSRRYATASDLARDLEALLAGAPVSARRLRPWERAWLWARRRPAAAALVALIVAAPSALFWRELRARRAIEEALVQTAEARGRAERNFADALEAVDRMLARVGHEALADVPQMAPVRRELLTDALELFEGFVARREGQDVDREVAETSERIADVHGLLGDYEAARAATSRALATWQSYAERAPDDPAPAQHRPNLLIQRARAERLTADVSAAIASATEAVSELDRRIAVEDAASGALATRAVARRELAEAFRAAGDWRRALDELDAALADLERAGDDSTESMRTRLRFGTIADESIPLASKDERADLRARAGELLAIALEEVRRLCEQRPHVAQLRRDRVRALLNLAIHRYHGGDVIGAGELIADAREHSARLVADYPSVATYAVDRMSVHSMAASIELVNGRIDDARELLDAVVEVGEELYAQRPGDADVAHPLANGWTNLAAIEVTIGRPGEALAPIERAIEILVALSGRAPSSLLEGDTLRGAQRIRALALLALGRWPEAARAAEDMAVADHGIAGPYRAAVLLGRCAAGAESDGSFAPIDEWVEAAALWLRVAVERGASPEDLNEPDLAPLRGRAAFVELVEELAGP